MHRDKFEWIHTIHCLKWRCGNWLTLSKWLGMPLVYLFFKNVKLLSSVFQLEFWSIWNINFLLQVLKNFLDTAEAEVRSLISLYSEVVSSLFAFQFVFLYFLWYFFIAILCWTLLILVLKILDPLPSREEMQIRCPSTLERIQLAVPSSKVQ